MITVGEVLKKQRENLDKSLEQVALDTKIQPRFIKYIEEDDFDKFDSPVYAQGFIKIYANYLDLNEDRILAIYRRSVPNETKKNPSVRETESLRQNRMKVTPKLIAVILSSIFLLGILSYIGYQIYQFQSPPTISISSPENEETLTEEKTVVKGITDTNTSLFINDNPVEISQEGNFQYEVTLNPGVNIITILAKKNNSTQETVETLKLTYTTPEITEEDIQDEEVEEKNIVKLQIVNSSVWVQFNVDKVNKLSQIVQAGEEYEYEVENQFSLTTGIRSSTKLFFNDEEVSLEDDSKSIGSITCQILEKDQINCE